MKKRRKIKGKLINIVNAVRNYEARKEMLNGREYLVAPVTILKVGVHCGSAGCFLYTEEELQKFPSAWDGSPLPVMHPTEAGQAVSANDLDVVEENIGQLFNVEFENGGLNGEIWVDVVKAEIRHSSLVSMIRKGELLEVSTGLWSDHEGTGGDYQGEAYDAEAINIRPDHLALLPGSTGACSADDGCGVRVHELMVSNGSNVVPIDKSLVIDVINILAKNQIAHEDVRASLQKDIDKMDVIRAEPQQSTVHYVTAVFDDFFVYRKEAPGGVTLLKQTYTVSNEGKITIGEEAKEVREKVSFVDVTNENKNDSKKTKKKGGNKTMCKDKVKALIDNEASKFTEDDREWLEGLEDEMAEKLEPVVIKDNADADADDKGKKKHRRKVNVNKDDADNAADDNDNDADDKDDKDKNTDNNVAVLSDDDKETLAYGKMMLKQKKDSLISTITGNEKNVFSKDELNKKDIDELKKLAALSHVDETDPDYSLNGGSGSMTDNSGAGKPLETPVMNFSKN